MGRVTGPGWIRSRRGQVSWRPQPQRNNRCRLVGEARGRLVCHLLSVSVWLFSLKLMWGGVFEHQNIPTIASLRPASTFPIKPVSLMIRLRLWFFAFALFPEAVSNGSIPLSIFCCCSLQQFANLMLVPCARIIWKQSLVKQSQIMLTISSIRSILPSFIRLATALHALDFCSTTGSWEVSSGIQSDANTLSTLL